MIQIDADLFSALCKNLLDDIWHTSMLGRRSLLSSISHVRGCCGIAVRGSPHNEHGEAGV